MARGLRIGYPRAVRISGDTTTYVLSGQAAGLLKGSLVAADYGTYGVTGQSAGLVPGVGVNVAPVWAAVSNAQFYLGTAATHALPVTDPNSDPLTLTSVGTALPSGVTLDIANRRLNWSGSGSAATTSGHQIRADDGVNDADTDWVLRSTATGVVWAHDFRNTAEMELFIRDGASSTNPVLSTKPNPIQSVAAGLGASNAIRYRTLGATLTQTTPSGSAGDVHVFNVTNTSDFPDPAVVGFYSVLVGNPSNDPGCYEYVEVRARDTGANTLTVRRRTTSDSYPSTVGGVNYPYPQAAPLPSGWTIGATANGQWIRPFAAFPSGQNGQATADRGIAAGIARARTWPTTKNNTGHQYFREGYYGARRYWDPAVNPSAPYVNWTPSDGGTRLNAFDGDEFYIQFRVKMGASALGGSNVSRKLWWIQSPNNSGSGQLFSGFGPTRFGEDTDPAELIGGVTYGRFIQAFTGGADSRQPAGGVLFSSVQSDSSGDPGAGIPWQTDYPNGTYANRFGANCYTFRLVSGVWITYLVHVKVGRDNAEAHHPGGISYVSLPGPYPSATDSTYRTTFELKVALPGWTNYKTLMSMSNATWFFGDQLGDLGYLFYNAPGLSAFWAAPDGNLYMGSGSVAPPSSSFDIDFSQVIFSQSPIACPQV